MIFRSLCKSKFDIFALLFFILFFNRILLYNFYPARNNNKIHIFIIMFFDRKNAFNILSEICHLKWSRTISYFLLEINLAIL